jgi:hypothetical protein
MSFFIYYYMRHIFQALAGILISMNCFSQQLKPSDLKGVWSINDTLGIHKDFKVLLVFENENDFICTINGEPYLKFSYALKNENDSTFILFKVEKDIDFSQSMKHWVAIKNDTLYLTPLYFIVKQEYNLPEKDLFYFLKN